MPTWQLKTRVCKLNACLFKPIRILGANGTQEIQSRVHHGLTILSPALAVLTHESLLIASSYFVVRSRRLSGEATRRFPHPSVKHLLPNPTFSPRGGFRGGSDLTVGISRVAGEKDDVFDT